MKNAKYILLLIISILNTQKINAQNWQWARHNGSNSFDGASNIVVDNNGNSYYLGGFSGPYCYFTNDTSSFCQGNDDFFIIKYDASGNEIWYKQLGSNNTLSTCKEGAGGMTIDNNNNLYVAGFFCGNITIGAFNLIGIGQEMYLAKFDSNGNCIWAVKAGGNGTDGANGVALDNSGYIYICGTNSNQAILGNDTIAAGGFIAKYDASGNVIWAKNKFRYFNSSIPSEILPIDIKIYNSNILITGGARNDTIVVDTITVLSPQIGVSASLSSFDLNGDVQWLRIFGGNSSDNGFDFSIDNSGNSYLSGLFYGNGYFENDTLTSSAMGDIYFTKYDINGNHQWVKQMYTTGGGWGLATSTSPSDGSTYVTGYFSGNASFGSYNINASTTKDMFLARYDGSGNCLGVRNFGQAEGHGVAQDSNGNPYICGTFLNTVNIGSNSFTSYGIYDIFAAKSDVFTGIGGDDRNANNQLIIYANPTTGKSNIIVPDDFVNEKNLTLSIYDNTGKLIQQKTLEMNDGKIKLNLEAEAKGVYNVTLNNKTKTYNGKIIFE